uniref:Protein quiver n=1 Tax=Panagrolaimus sp. JU765 TaxID=591449 RepID=A0AC34RJK9_9BILA
MSGLLNALICFTFLVFTGNALKCHKCASYDYIPAIVLNQLGNLNISINDLDISSSGNCKSSDDFCSNGTWCAKQTATYSLNFNGVKYTYNAYHKTCLNQRPDTNGQPDGGKCYDDTTAATTYEAGITRKVQWCYCKNKDFCNSGMMFMPHIVTGMIIYFLNRCFF